MKEIAYLVSQYPAISHTFVVREVQGLRACGMTVHTFSIRGADCGELLSDLDREEHRGTTPILPTTFGRFVRAHWTTAATAPLRYLRALGTALTGRPPGVRAAVWGLFYFAEAAILAAELRKRGLLHVHAHFANVTADVALLASRMIGGRWSLTLHGESDFGNPVGNQLGRKIGDAAFVVCVSEFGRAQAMLRSRPEHWEKIRVVHTGIDPQAFFPRPDGVHGSGDSGPLRLLAVGRLSPEKGQVFLLHALRMLADRGVACSCRIIGDGPLRPMLTAMAKELGVSGTVTFVGAFGHDRLRPQYQDADVFVLPSLSEGLPVVLMEAMACGLPVVASRIAGIPELVQDGAHGLLVVPGSPEALADAVQQLADDPVRRRAMGHYARRRVSEHFDARASAAQLALIFSELGDGRAFDPSACAPVTEVSAAHA